MLNLTKKQKLELYRNLRQMFLMAGLLTLVLVFADKAMAANALPLGEAYKFGSGNAGDAGIVGDPGGETIIESLANLVGGFSSTDTGILGKLRGLVAAAAIAMTVYSALKMLLAQGEESKVTSAKKGIYMGILGLILISLAGEFTKILSVNKDTTVFIATKTGTALQCSFYSNTFLGGAVSGSSGGPNMVGAEMLCRVNLFNSTSKLVITFFKYLIGSIAVYEIISSAYRIITLGSETSNLERDKKNILFGAVGLLVIIFAESVISKVFYSINFKAPYSQLDGVQPKVDISEAARQIAAVANLAVSIIGPILIAIIIGASIMYMTSGGNEDKQNQAKRAIGAAAVGMLVIYGAFGLVSTVIGGQFA